LEILVESWTVTRLLLLLTQPVVMHSAANTETSRAQRCIDFMSNSLPDAFDKHATLCVVLRGTQCTAVSRLLQVNQLLTNGDIHLSNDFRRTATHQRGEQDDTRHDLGIQFPHSSVQRAEFCQAAAAEERVLAAKHQCTGKAPAQHTHGTESRLGTALRHLPTIVQNS
jgi:hypothetical protein